MGPDPAGVRYARVPAGAVVRVFTAAGRPVRTLPAGSGGRWDLRTDAGAGAPAGVYLAHVRTPGAPTRLVRFALARAR